MSWFEKVRGRKIPAEPPVPAKRTEPVAAPPAEPSPGVAAAKFLKHVDDLKAIPGVASRLLQTLEDPKVSADAIAQEIRRDQGLTAMVLRLANSAFYKSSGQVRDITESIVVLGYDTTRQLVLGRLSRQVLRKNDDWQKGLWRHALATALGAQACARQLKGVTVAHAFTAGLLHDIGKAVMHEAFPDECVRVWAGPRKDGRSSDQVEREQFGTDHAEIGHELLKSWQFPTVYQLVARFHARAGEPMPSPKEQRIVWMVALAGAVASSMGHDAVLERKGPDTLEHWALLELGAPPSLIETMQMHVATELGPLVEIFG